MRHELQRIISPGAPAGLSAEVVSHETLFQQFKDAPGPVLAVSAVIIVATIIPIVRGSAVLDDGAGEGLKVRLTHAVFVEQRWLAGLRLRFAAA